MFDDTNNLIDVVLTIVTMGGAGIAFIHRLREWRFMNW